MNTTLENYFRTHIWSPLNAGNTTFHPELRRSHLPPQLEMGHRVGVGQGIESLKPGEIILEYPLKDDLAGIGLFQHTKGLHKASRFFA